VQHCTYHCKITIVILVKRKITIAILARERCCVPYVYTNMEYIAVVLTISFLSLRHYRELLQPVLLSLFKLLLSRDRSWKTVALLCYTMHQCKHNECD